MIFKDYVARQLINKKLHFKCDCLIPIDFSGTIVGYHINNNEIIFQVIDENRKIIDIGENHPNMTVTEI